MVGDPPEGVELVGRPSRRSGTDWQTLPKIQKWSGDYPGGSEVVGDTPGGMELVRRPSQR